ncbi:hypothetical protein LAUMK4_03362 [Mycobacterium persicum]|uniref:Uncharacterized protein n=1 Tax=Mycobacterium persicum TaxID=1487726 RepID=A0ABY6RKN5_9MYCO|nr:hypothetical protein [Mycobacterium persicum]VAZ77186.1 hypothetical protein LAUMK15_03675 [Mycobacterium persicum]VAZ96054.1 hypothetical protein LAUMK4_03362 [Mycobacterium persicum]
MTARRFLAPRMSTATLMAVVSLAIAMSAPVGAVPDTQCTLATPVQEVQSVSQLPAELRQILPPIADIGAPFNKTDAVTDPTLPFRRLIRAGSRDNDWFVWYEHGGITYFWQAVVLRVVPGAETKTVGNAGTVSDLLCVATDGAFAGQVPPYPQGSWAESLF